MIFKYLDLSAEYVRSKDMALLEDPLINTLQPIRVIKHDYGCFINVVSEDIREAISNLKRFGYSVMFIHLYYYAFNNNCNWVNIDYEGTDERELPIPLWEINYE